jgi:hypothetical protein
MNIHFISSGAFTDAGGWYIGSDGKIHRIPGWNPEAFSEVARAVNVLSQIGGLKTPGVADGIINSLVPFVQRELGAHMKDGGVLVVR